jgi:hypothetical protein
MLGSAVTGAALTAALLLAVLFVRDTPVEVTEPGRLEWPIVDARVFDPTRPELARDPDLARAAFDGDAQTVWSPGDFTTTDLDGSGGVGLLIDLGSPREVRGITLRLARGGSDVAVHFALTEPDVRDGVEGLEPPISVQRSVRSLQRLEFSPIEARWWVVWVTGVSPNPVGTFSFELAEVSVLGPG